MSRNLGMYFVVSDDSDDRIKISDAKDAQLVADSWSNPESLELLQKDGVDVSKAKGHAAFWSDFAELLEKHGMGRRVTELPTAHELAKNIHSDWSTLDAGMVDALAPGIPDGKYDAVIGTIRIKNVIEVSNGKVNPYTVEYAARLENAQSAINYERRRPSNRPVQGNSCVYIEDFKWDAPNNRFKISYGT